MAILYTAEPAERSRIIAWTKNYLQPTLTDHLVRVKSSLEQFDAEQLLQGVRSGETFQDIASCGKTETLAVKKSAATEIYRWTDDKGRVHFGDAKPGQSRNSEVMSVNYPDRKHYFNLQLIKDTRSLPPFTQDRVNADVRQVYGILSRDMHLEHLRQVFLNVRVIETQAAFQQYRAAVAPQLSTNSGFYSSKDNEAVVFQGNDPEVMRAVIRHEASHVIMAGLYGITPTWFNEGMAEYFEQLEIRGQSRTIKPVTYHWTHLRMRSAEGGLTSLQDYLNMPPQRWYDGDLQDNYALAWSLVYFLMTEDEGKAFLKRMMNDMAQHYCWTAPSSDYFNQHYPGGLAAFEHGWSNWLARQLPAAHRY